MSNNKRDNFSPDVVRKVAERASYFCSNPNCHRITIGPMDNNNTASTKTGIAAHICAASPGGPRYDMSQSSAQRKSINNAIWLCGTCSILIDKNNGIDYPSDHLRKWKLDHEKLISECLKGGKRLMIQFLDPQPNDIHIGKKLITYLEQRGVFFMDFQNEVPQYVFDSIKEVRTYLTQLQIEIEPDSPLEIIVESINHACRHFMNTTGKNCSEKEIAYSLGAMRKVIGINLKDLQNTYNHRIGSPLSDIMPI